MPNTDAEKRAIKKYREEKQGRVEIAFKKEYKESLIKHATAHGEKLNEFIRRAIAETMARDNESPAQE
jgi:hypothetical protein